MILRKSRRGMRGGVSVAWLGTQSGTTTTGTTTTGTTTPPSTNPPSTIGSTAGSTTPTGSTTGTTTPGSTTDPACEALGCEPGGKCEVDQNGERYCKWASTPHKELHSHTTLHPSPSHPRDSPCGTCPSGATCKTVPGTDFPQLQVPYCECPQGFGMTATECVAGFGMIATECVAGEILHPPHSLHSLLSSLPHSLISLLAPLSYLPTLSPSPLLHLSSLSNVG
ncbi:unnamed protein product [Closterium sp. NIES-65]|nr:unnamed protein product [Closterium sp. NIES-65]